MAKVMESGRATMIKGSLLYLWEEIKTMNRTKFRALSTIFRGYFRMKLSMVHPEKNKQKINDYHNW